MDYQGEMKKLVARESVLKGQRALCHRLGRRLSGTAGYEIVRQEREAIKAELQAIVEAQYALMDRELNQQKRKK